MEIQKATAGSIRYARLTIWTSSSAPFAAVWLVFFCCFSILELKSQTNYNARSRTMHTIQDEEKEKKKLLEIDLVN